MSEGSTERMKKAFGIWLDVLQLDEAARAEEFRDRMTDTSEKVVPE